MEKEQKVKESKRNAGTFLTDCGSKIREWWTSKTAVGKLLSVLCVLAVVCIVYVCVSFAGTYYADKKRHAALTATDAEGRPLNSRVFKGKVYVPNPDITTILVMGIDHNDDVDVNELEPYNMGQSDVIMLVAFDKKNKTIKVVNVPRDSMVNVKTYAPDGSIDTVDYSQLCLQYAYGRTPKHCAQLTEKVLTEQVFPGISIDYYAAMHISALPLVINALGGVDITMTDTYDFGYTVYNEGETYHMEASEAVPFVQYRDIEIYGSCMDRSYRQKDFYKALYLKAKEAIKADPTIVARIYSDVKRNLNTDISLTDTVALATEMIDAQFSMEDSYTILPGEVGEAVDWKDKMVHNTYELDKDGVKQVMMDTWYLPWDGDTK